MIYGTVLVAALVGGLDRAAATVPLPPMTGRFLRPGDETVEEVLLESESLRCRVVDDESWLK